MPEAHIAGSAIAVPPAFSTEHFIEIDREMRARHGQPPEVAEMAASFARNTGIKQRHTFHPAFLQEQKNTQDFEDIFTDEDFDPPLWQRLAFYKKHAPTIAIKAAKAAVKDWGGSVDDISHVITTATSGWMEPGLASAIIHGLGLSLDTQKAELNFNGCFCGATCLRLARDTVRAGESKAVLVLAMELSITHYDPVDTQISSLLANSLFGDGAAAVVVAPEGEWCFAKSGMSIVPGTQEYLTFSPPVTPDRQTYEMFLDRRVGSGLAHYFREQRGKGLLDAIFDFTKGEHPALAVHPGGPNILEAVLEVFKERGWPDDVLKSSFHTLHNYGNMGSAAILFVLANTLPQLKGDKLATFAFGPGVTVEWGYYERV